MPMLEVISIGSGGGDLAYNEILTKCHSGRMKSPQQRKTKSAIMCVGMTLCTLVLFVFVAVDLSKISEESWRLPEHGSRVLATIPYRLQSHTLLAKQDVEVSSRQRREHVQAETAGAALEGMGTLYRKGTRGMPELVVAHLSETTTSEDLRVFLRALHRSGLPARADVIFLFPSRSLAVEFAAVIHEEEIYFQRLLAKYQPRSSEARNPTDLEGIRQPELSIFHHNAYFQSLSVVDSEKATKYSVWGKVHNQTSSKTADSEVVQEEQVDEDGVNPHFGAVVGFDVQELDPDDTLTAFLDSPSLNHRRWICYQILLGMIRHKYRHVFLTEVSGVVILKDIFLQLKKKDMGLHLFHTGKSWSFIESQSKKNETNNVREMDGSAAIGMLESVYGKGLWNSLDVEEKCKKVISTGVILGGMRPVRSLTTAMATEIVRVALLRKNRMPFNVEIVLSYLVHKSSVLGSKVASHLQVHESSTSTVNLLPGGSRENDSKSPSINFHRRDRSVFAVLQGLNHEEFPEARRRKILKDLREDICSSQNDVDIYTDCYELLSADTDFSFL